jgi:hypothetical protein
MTTIICFKRYSTDENNNTILSYDSDQPTFTVTNDTLYIERAGSYNLNTGVTIAANTPYILAITLSSPSGIKVRLNGVEVYSNTTTYSSYLLNCGNACIGKHFNTTNLYFAGRIANVMTAASVLSADDISNIEAYLSYKYQIAIGSTPTISSYDPYTEASGLCTVHGTIDASGVDTTTLSVSDAASIGGTLTVGSDITATGQNIYCEQIQSSVFRTNGIYYEGSICVGYDTSSNYYYGSYLYGGVFFIDGSNNPTSNFYFSLYNVPVDTGASYTISLMYHQMSTTYYCNKIRIQDASGEWIIGGANSWSTPYFNGGLPSFSTSPNLVIQQFSIVSIPDNTLTTQRYCGSSVSPFS